MFCKKWRQKPFLAGIRPHCNHDHLFVYKKDRAEAAVYRLVVNETIRYAVSIKINKYPKLCCFCWRMEVVAPYIIY